MNAVTLTVVAMIYSAATGQITVVAITNEHSNMDSCLNAAASVIEMDNVLAFDCQWITVDEKVWRITFGHKI